MNPSRSILVAFLASGAIWVTGSALAMPAAGLVLILAAAAYVTLGSLLIASRRLPTGPALLALWATTVLVLTAMGYLADGELWTSLVVWGVLSTLLFVPWCLTGLFLLLVFTGGAHGGPHPGEGS